MKTDFRQVRSGASLFLILASLTSCRQDHPPAFPIGTSDGFGGADFSDTTGELKALGCVPKEGGDGNRYYCPPSVMKDFWVTTQTGMTAYSAWCYGGTPAQMQTALDQLKKNIAE